MQSNRDNVERSFPIYVWKVIANQAKSQSKYTYVKADLSTANVRILSATMTDGHIQKMQKTVSSKGSKEHRYTLY